MPASISPELPGCSPRAGPSSFNTYPPPFPPQPFSIGVRSAAGSTRPGRRYHSRQKIRPSVQPSLPFSELRRFRRPLTGEPPERPVGVGERQTDVVGPLVTAPRTHDPPAATPPRGRRQETRLKTPVVRPLQATPVLLFPRPLQLTAVVTAPAPAGREGLSPRPRQGLKEVTPAPGPPPEQKLVQRRTLVGLTETALKLTVLKGWVPPGPAGRGALTALLTEPVTGLLVTQLRVKGQPPSLRAPQLPRIPTELVRTAAVNTVGGGSGAAVGAARAPPRAMRFVAVMGRFAPR